jgi:LmbE family N-acetylglucosaminyl deacetylase
MSAPAKVVVLAPHADDELLGCGGTLARLSAQGADVHVIVVFDGAAGDPRQLFDPSRYVQEREAEARRGGEHIGVTSYEFWRLPEGHVASEEDLAEHLPRLAVALSALAPDLLLAPWSGDGHADHASVARAVEAWVESVNPDCEVWGYEVWSELEPDVLVDVTETWHRKLAGLEEHRTQRAYRDLVAWTHSRARSAAGRWSEGFHRLRPARTPSPSPFLEQLRR